MQVDDIVEGNILPYVKDDSANNVWGLWQPEDRDLFFIRKDGIFDRKLNLTSSFNENQIKQIIDENIDMLNNGLLIPEEITLDVYPNPFNPSTNIEFSISKSSYCSITIYDSMGREIELLYNSYLISGKYSFKWNAAQYSSGIYFVKLETEFQTFNQKLIYNK